jgi:hypothetical protein
MPFEIDMHALGLFRGEPRRAAQVVEIAHVVLAEDEGDNSISAGKIVLADLRRIADEIALIATRLCFGIAIAGVGFGVEATV